MRTKLNQDLVFLLGLRTKNIFNPFLLLESVIRKKKKTGKQHDRYQLKGDIYILQFTCLTFQI